MRKLVLYISMSVDGYIAEEGDNLNFLSVVEKEGEDYGYSNFIDSVDTVIIGKRTYDWVIKQTGEFHHVDKKTYVRTRTERLDEGNTTFYTGDLKTLVQKLKTEDGKTIFCDGGAQLVNELLNDQLIDELILSVIPILLGKGIRLFNYGQASQHLELIDSKRFEKGLVQLHYKVKS